MGTTAAPTAELPCVAETMQDESTAAAKEGTAVMESLAERVLCSQLAQLHHISPCQTQGRT